MTMYKDLKYLCEKKIEQTKCVILGNGVSVTQFKPNDSVFTIGVNDICQFYSPDILLLADTLARFKRKGIVGRIDAIRNGTPKYYVINDKNWDFPQEKTYYVKYGRYRKFCNFENKNIIDIGLDSPYIAIQLAYKMGFKQIAMIGVDYTENHFYRKDGVHELAALGKMNDIISMYGQLKMELDKRKVNLYNLSKESKITSVPYIEYEKFLEL